MELPAQSLGKFNFAGAWGTGCQLSEGVLVLKALLVHLESSSSAVSPAFAPPTPAVAPVLLMSLPAGTSTSGVFASKVGASILKDVIFCCRRTPRVSSG